MHNHENDPALAAQLLAQFDEVEKLEADAGLSAAPEDTNAGREYLAGAITYLLSTARCRAHVDDILAGLKTAIRARQPSPSVMPNDEVNRWESRLVAFRFTGDEIDELKLYVLRENERLVEILPRAVVTDQRTIPRQDLIVRRGTWTDGNWGVYVARSFPSEAALADLESQYEADQRAIEQAGIERQRSFERDAIVQQQREAAARPQAEAQEDFYWAMVERARARHGAK